MSSQPELEFASATDTGLVRAHNEDSLAIDEFSGLGLVADGMGGYAAGEIASSIAATTVTQVVQAGLKKRAWQHRTLRASAIQQLLLDAVEQANTAILTMAQKRPECAGMGTTLIAALFQQQQVWIAHVGDSRAYRLRGTDIEQLTHDHSPLQEQIDAGLISSAEARFAPHKNLITRALGIGAGSDVEIHAHPLVSGDIFLLCSDGLSDLLTEREMAIVIHSRNSLTQAAEQLIQCANNNGGRDNISAILIRVESARAARDSSGGWLDSLTNWAK